MVSADCRKAEVCPSAASLWQSSVLVLVRSVVPVTQRKGAAEPLYPEGCGSSSKEEVCICTEREPGISMFGIAVEVS